ncbi:MAG: DUF927 domain-containing protein [Synergistaceae bacterium]|nr:DUF927 domain-containing protein [Synergistaceae bacterium]
MNLLEFFHALYGDADANVYLWTMPDKRTRVFSTSRIQEMANAALGLSAAGQNVYFGVGSCVPRLGEYERPKADAVQAIPALWCDIDIAGGGHAASDLPPDAASAQSLLPPALPPSIIVHSGNGLHVYWIFNELWQFNDDDRAYAEALLRSVQGYIRAQARERGWIVDPTADLPRVLRCPDTMNYKDPARPKRCVVLSASSVRYNPSDFDILPPVEAPSTEGRTERFQRRHTDAEAEFMLQNCAFLQYCQTNAASITYNEWMTALTNIVRGCDGIEAAHSFSRLDVARYDHADTDRKITEAVGKMNPQGCAYIRNTLGFKGCPAGGCGVKAPCGWSLGRTPQARAIVRGINNITAEAVFDPDVIGALAELKVHDKLEYGRFVESCKGIINIANLGAAVKQALGKPVAPDNTVLAAESPLAEASAALEPGDALGDMTTRRAIKDSPLDLNVPENFSFGMKGVYYQTTTREGVPKYIRACGTPILISRRIYNLDTSTEKVEVAFRYFNAWRRVVQPRNAVYVARNVTCLANYGVNVTSETAKYLVRYLSELENCNQEIIPMEPAVSYLGWRLENGEQVFLTPTDSRYHFDMDDSGEITGAFVIRGDFSAWLARSRDVRGYPAARFILAASFATPLLKIFQHRNFMIYFWGTSGGGKTAAMTWALSVWGLASQLMVNFNMSMSGLEGRLALTNDLPAGINERQAAGGGRDKQEWLERIVYMVEGGRGKARATTSGIRKTLSWRTIGLACGEEPLSTEASIQGVKTRLLEFNSFPVVPNELAKSLYAESARHCGHAGKYFTDRLIAELKVNPDVIYDTYTAIQEELAAAWPEYFSVHIDAVALVCLADFLTSQWLFCVVPDKAREEARSLASYIMGQLPNRAQISDTERSWEFVKGWILSNAERIDHFGGGYRDARMTPKYGVEDDGYIFLYPTILSKAMEEAGFAPQKNFREWANMGRIETELCCGERRYKIQKRVDGIKTRFIKIDKTELNV